MIQAAAVRGRPRKITRVAVAVVTGVIMYILVALRRCRTRSRKVEDSIIRREGEIEGRRREGAMGFQVIRMVGRRKLGGIQIRGVSAEETVVMEGICRSFCPCENIGKDRFAVQLMASSRARSYTALVNGVIKAGLANETGEIALIIPLVIRLFHGHRNSSVAMYTSGRKRRGYEGRTIKGREVVMERARVWIAMKI